MTASIDLDPDDVPPDLSADDSPLRCQEPGCVNAVVKPARGRTPKFCPEHSKTSAKGTRKSGWSMASQVELVLTQYFAVFGSAVAIINPADGRPIVQGAQPVAHEIVELARSKPKWRKQLELVCKPGEYGPLMLALLPVVVPILANHGLLPQLFIPGLTPVPDPSEGRVA
jgi:hypothetical protein